MIRLFYIMDLMNLGFMEKKAIAPSKAEQVLTLVKALIQEGVFPEGCRLPSEQELSLRYGVSRNTVREAIRSLIQEGLVARRQGKGTFVVYRPRPTVATERFALFLRAHSHVFEAETRMLVRGFQRAGALPIVFDVEDLNRTPGAEREILHRLIAESISGLVGEDSLLSWLAGCARVELLPPTVILNFAPDAPPVPALCIVSDFTFGTALGTRHLLQNGRRRILFLIHYNDWAYRHAPHEAAGLYGSICRGYAQTMKEAGLEPAYFFVRNEFREGDDTERLLALFRSPERPDALFAFGDNRAKRAIDLAAEAGLNVPEDLAVIGYWNTPWAEMTRVPLTSVSIGEEEITRLALDRLLKAARTKAPLSGRILVKPRLVLRQSCGTSRLSNESVFWSDRQQ